MSSQTDSFNWLNDMEIRPDIVHRRQSHTSVLAIVPVKPHLLVGEYTELVRVARPTSSFLLHNQQQPGCPTSAPSES